MYHLSSTYSIISQLFQTNRNTIVVFPCFDLDPVKTLEAIVKYKCNTTVLLPKILVNLIDEAETQKKQRNIDLSNVLFVGVGGQITSGHLIERTRKIFPNSLAYINVLASTECHFISMARLQMRGFSSENYGICVGQPYPFVECKIVNPANGKIQPLGVEGELHVRSYGVTTGYWNDPEMTQKVLDQSRW